MVSKRGGMGTGISKIWAYFSFSHSDLIGSTLNMFPWVRFVLPRTATGDWSIPVLTLTLELFIAFPLPCQLLRVGIDWLWQVSDVQPRWSTCIHAANPGNAQTQQKWQSPVLYNSLSHSSQCRRNVQTVEHPQRQTVKRFEWEMRVPYLHSIWEQILSWKRKVCNTCSLSFLFLQGGSKSFFLPLHNDHPTEHFWSLCFFFHLFSAGNLNFPASPCSLSDVH